MPSARPSATATMTTSSRSEPPADFCLSSRLVVGGGLARGRRLGLASPSASAGAASAGAASSAAAASGALPSPVVSGSAAVSAAPPASTTSVAVSPSASTASVAAAASASSAAAGSWSSPGSTVCLGAGVAALAHASSLADALAQVVELRAPHVAAGRDVDLLDLRRVHRERALDADAEGLLADREGLARSVALALDDHALEDLRTTTRPFDDLEVDADAVAGPELGHAAQLRALEAVDDGAHGEKTARGRFVHCSRGRLMVANRPGPTPHARGCARAASGGSPRGGRTAGPPARASRGTRPGACSAGTRGRRRARR